MTDTSSPDPTGDEQGRQQARFEFFAAQDPAEGSAPAGVPLSEVAEQMERRYRIQEFFRLLFEFTPRTYVTPVLVGACLVVFVAMLARGVDVFRPETLDLIAWGANYGPKTTGGQWWRLFSCMFLHGGLIHLALNMWVLWNVGRLVERLLGNVAFVVVYVFSGLIGSAASVFFHPHITSVGASGAIFGLFGALVGLLARHHGTIPMEIIKSLRGSAITCIGINLILGRMIPGIDNAAHIGGLVAGFAGGLAFSGPVTREALGRRGVRAVLMGVAAAAIVAATVVYVLPKNVVDVHELRSELVKTEGSVRPAYVDAKNRWAGGDLSDDEFAEILESEVIVPWRTLRMRIDNAPRVIAEQKEEIDQLGQYMKLREDAWQSLLESVRESDAEKKKRFDELWKAADEMVKKMNE